MPSDALADFMANLDANGVTPLGDGPSYGLLASLLGSGDSGDEEWEDVDSDSDGGGASDNDDDDDDDDSEDGGFSGGPPPGLAGFMDGSGDPADFVRGMMGMGGGRIPGTPVDFDSSEHRQFPSSPRHQSVFNSRH